MLAVAPTAVVACVRCPQVNSVTASRPFLSPGVVLSLTNAASWANDRTILASNAVATGQDGIRAGGTMGVTPRNNKAAANKAPKALEEAGCGTATGAVE